MFKKFIFFILYYSLGVTLFGDVCLEKDSRVSPRAELFSVTVNQPQQFSAVRCLLLCLSKGEDKFLESIARQLRFDLEFTDQLAIEVKRSLDILSQSVIQKLFKQGTSLCLYLQKVSEKKRKKEMIIRAQVVDLSSQESIFQKEYACLQNQALYGAHTIAADIVPLLTGWPSVTLSTLAYCKQLSSKHKIICKADYACLQEKTVVSKGSINVAPCWHPQDPLLFYSQFTKTNSRLMSVDLTGRHRVICSYDGLNMQPSFSKDGKQVALCLSGVSGNAELYLYDQWLCHKLKKRVYVPLTANGGNNVSPTLLANRNVIFCSDFETSYPQIYYLDYATKDVYRITSGKGHCAAPAYNEKKNAIVYIRLVKGVFQLFSCGLEEGKRIEKQLTFDGRDKLDPTWSPCGNYVAFTLECFDQKTRKKTPQIAVLNTFSGKIRVLTTSKEPKSFAAWTEKTLF